MALTQEQQNTLNGFQAVAAVVKTMQQALTQKADLSGGKVAASQVPDLAIVDFLGQVADQTAMLALNGQKGDWCTRSDNGKVYIITGTPTNTIGAWQPLTYPASPVLDNFSYANAFTAALV